MSLAKRVAEGSALLVSRELFVSLVGIGITIILVRYLGKFDYGRYALFVSAVAIASIFLMGSLSSVIVADVSRELEEGKKERAKALLIRYSQFIMMVSFFISFVIFLLSLPVSRWYGDEVGRLVVVIAFIIPFYALNNVLLTIFHSHSRFDRMALVSIVEAVGRLAFVIAAVVVFDDGLMGAVYSQLFGIFLSSLVVVYPAYSTVRYLKEVPRARIGLFYRMLLGHGKFVIAAGPVYQLREQVLPWIVQFFLGVEAVAVFTVAKRGVDFFNTLLFSINQVYLPLLSSEMSKGAKRINLIMNRSIKYLLASSCIIVITGIIIAPFLFEILFSTKYLESVPIFRMILPAVFVAALYSIINPVFMAYKGQKYIFGAFLISLVTTVISVSLLTPVAGLPGSAAGYLIGMFVFIVVLYYYLRHMNPELKWEFSLMFTVDEYDRWLVRKIYGRLKR